MCCLEKKKYLGTHGWMGLGVSLVAKRSCADVGLGGFDGFGGESCGYADVLCRRKEKGRFRLR